MTTKPNPLRKKEDEDKPLDKKGAIDFLDGVMRVNNKYTKQDRINMLMTEGVPKSTAYWFDHLYMQDEKWESVRDKNKTNQVLEDKNRALENCRHQLKLAEINEDEEKIMLYSKELLTLHKLSRNF